MKSQSHQEKNQWELVAQFVKLFLEVAQFITTAEKGSDNDNIQTNPEFILRCNLIGEVFVLERIRRLFDAIESLMREKLVVDEELKRKVIHKHIAMFVSAILPDLDEKEVEKSITEKMEAIFAKAEHNNDFNIN